MTEQPIICDRPDEEAAAYDLLEANCCGQLDCPHFEDRSGFRWCWHLESKVRDVIL